MNGVHDVGGQHGHGPVVAETDEPVFHQPWEGRVYALMRLALRRGLFNLDEFRRALEGMSPARYLDAGYYERWLFALESLIGEKVAQRGLAAATPSTDDRPPLRPRFAPGARVRARNRHSKHHTRLARYVRGRSGTVESVRGPYLLPDANAHGPVRRWEPVYTVVFDASELWGDAAEGRERVSIDLWESYLEEDG